MSDSPNPTPVPDDDHWEIYVTFVDDKPAVILVDLGAAETAPVQAKTSLVWLWVHLKDPDDEGFPSEDEDLVLNEIEDAVTESVNADTTKYVGRITSDGRREFYFYTDNPQSFREVATIAMATSAATGYQFELDDADDPEWRHYQDVLYPSPEDFQQIHNQHVISQLYQAGDSLTEPRPVDHFANFASPEAREAFAKAAVALGFEEVSRPDRTDDTGFPFALGLLRVDSVDAETIDRVTFELFELAQEHQGEYEGWGSSVVKK